MKKILGITLLLLTISALTASISENFLGPYNLENVVHRISLFGVLGIGAAFVIITGGIDLSIGSVVALVGTLLPWLLVEAGLSPWLAVPAVLLLSALLGYLHGTLITRLGLQPFVVTLCGLLFYRGFARYWTDDQTQGFGNTFEGLRQLAIARPVSMGSALLGAGALLSLLHVLRRRWTLLPFGLLAAGGGVALQLAGEPYGQLAAPAPFLMLLVIAIFAAVYLNDTVHGRYLLAVGRNEDAARYSGVDTGRVVRSAYVLCSLLAGIGGVLFALDVNSVQPAVHGSFYELYAIAAAVLGGCSLRGGEGSITGVVMGTGVMIVLYNSINLLGIPTQLEFAIIGAVILAGVTTDELVKRLVAARRSRRA